MTTKTTRPKAAARNEAPTQAIRYITIKIPVITSFPLDSSGNTNDGGNGHIETRLGRGPAQGMHRVLLALQSMATNARSDMPDNALPPWKHEVSASDVAKYLFHLVEQAAASEAPAT